MTNDGNRTMSETRLALDKALAALRLEVAPEVHEHFRDTLNAALKEQDDEIDRLRNLLKDMSKVRWEPGVHINNPQPGGLRFTSKSAAAVWLRGGR